MTTATALADFPGLVTNSQPRTRSSRAPSTSSQRGVLTVELNAPTSSKRPRTRSQMPRNQVTALAAMPGRKIATRATTRAIRAITPKSTR